MPGLKARGIAAMDGLPPIDGPLSIVLAAYLPIPNSWSRKKQAAALDGDIMPISGIDLDNIIKQVDGLNYHPPRFKGDREKRPIIWLNDSQIVSIQALKFYSDEPRLEISVYYWDVGPKEPELI
jgi:Holliday junction resolvase RusA-like endonuclease